MKDTQTTIPTRPTPAQVAEQLRDSMGLTPANSTTTITPTTGNRWRVWVWDVARDVGRTMLVAR